MSKNPRVSFAPIDFEQESLAAASARRAVTGVGEPWTFGLRPEALPAYLEERGLRLVKDMSANEYRTHTMGAAAASAEGCEFYHVALVEVGGQARPD